MVPAKADAEEQECFLEKILKPHIEKARQGKQLLYFVDAAHFVLAPFLGYLWSFARIFIKAPSGRQRFNVLGALNALTKDVVTVTNTAYINAESVCDLLKKLRDLNPDQHITIILDNARYQKCKLVQNMGELLRIELCYLPPYSPNLNLIERMWKFVKKESLNSIYYENFDLFQNAISKCLHETTTVHKAALESLLTLNFQTFKKAQDIAA